jgi:hypothetical protein
MNEWMDGGMLGWIYGCPDDEYMIGWWIDGLIYL